MKRYVACFFLILLSSACTYAQSCGTPNPTAEDEIFFNKFKLIQKKASNKTARIQSNAITYLPVKVHIIRNDDGSGGVSIASINDRFAALNRDFLPLGIQFYFCGVGGADGSNTQDFPHYINNTTYNTTIDALNGNTYIGIVSTYNVNNAINVYLSNAIINGSGFANLPNSTFNHIFLTYGAFTSLISKTLLHEFGHYFGLYHTFENSNHATVSQRELVSRSNLSNCSTKGDRLCDTPADPFERLTSSQKSIVNNACNYTLTTPVDANGQIYQPSIINVMSYWNGNCRQNNQNGLTNGQYERMKIGYLARTDINNQYTLDCSPTSQSAPSNLTIATITNGLQIQWSDNATTETGYFIERAESADGPFVCIGGVASNVTSFVDYEVVANRNYYYRVRASNSFGYSAVVLFANPTSNINYCMPNYTIQACAATSTFLTRVKINGTTLDNISSFPSPCNINNYSDFTSLSSINLVAGQSYTFTLRGVSNAQHYAIWIDANQNGIFENAELLSKSITNTDLLFSTDKSIAVTLPTLMLNGSTRLRVRTADFSSGGVLNACVQYAVGETEDYTVSISNGTTLPQIQLTSTPANLCASQSYTIHFTTTGTFAANNTFTAELSDKYGNFTNVTTLGSATTSPILVTLPNFLAPSELYRIRIVSSTISSGNESSFFTIYTKPEASIVVTGSTVVCLPNSVTLTANTGEGNGYIWKKDGNVIAPTTQSIQASSSGQYLVEVNQNGCISESGVVNVTVNPKVNVVLSGDTTIYAGQPATLTATFTNGNPPYSITLSNQQQFTNIASSTYNITVAPSSTTSYNISQASNTECGVGSTSGNALVTVIQTQYPCPPTISLTTTNNLHQASDYINTANSLTITGSANVLLRAGKSIVIDATTTKTFETLNGAVFEAKIQGCQ